jgi:hypothetical protein
MTIRFLVDFFLARGSPDTRPLLFRDVALGFFPLFWNFSDVHPFRQKKKLPARKVVCGSAPR